MAESHNLNPSITMLAGFITRYTLTARLVLSTWSHLTHYHPRPVTLVSARTCLILLKRVAFWTGPAYQQREAFGPERDLLAYDNSVQSVQSAASSFCQLSTPLDISSIVLQLQDRGSRAVNPRRLFESEYM